MRIQPADMDHPLLSRQNHTLGMDPPSPVQSMHVLPQVTQYNRSRCSNKKVREKRQL